MATINPKKLDDLKGASYNPRYITKKQLDTLTKSIEQFGDLSGIVFNRSSGVLVSGHQRIKSIKGKKTKIVKENVKKDRQGTVGLGHVHVFEDDGTITKIPYREVAWDDKLQEMAANVAANAAGGEFDQAKLGAIMAKLEKGKFDIELTSIDNWTTAKAIGKFKKTAGDESESSGGGSSASDDSSDESYDVIDPTAMKFQHCCPKCGYGWDDSKTTKKVVGLVKKAPVTKSLVTAPAKKTTTTKKTPAVKTKTKAKR
jgi:hypothetical protein